MRRLVRYLIASLVALAGSAAFAQPLDHQVVCTVVVDDVPEVTTIGVALLVEGDWHVRLVEDWDCSDGTLALVGPEGGEIVIVEGVLRPVVDGSEGEPLAEVQAQLPQEAIDGMLQAQRNRTRAQENRDRAGPPAFAGGSDEGEAPGRRGEAPRGPDASRDGRGGD